MNVVFCTTCKGRIQHLARTLPQNLADNPKAKFVVLDYNDPGDMAAYFKTNHVAEIESGRLVVYRYSEPVPFRMAHAKNMAHRLGILEGADILVNLDADNFTGANFDEYVASKLPSQDTNLFLWSRMIKEGDGRLPRGISGRIAVTRTNFLLAGGYDEKYDTHSPDDKDFNARLRRLGGDGREIDNSFLQAIPHTDRMRYREYPHVSTGSYDVDFSVEQDTTVVNAGSVGCGIVYRNYSGFKPLVIPPIPTRIFGIGMHKTATTSLHTALTQLGFKSGHWLNAHWAKAIWREMNQRNKSLTLEQHYALCDLPIPLLFRKLDVAYPGSKFILTVREEWNWLTSVRKHWNPGYNRFKDGWDMDPFSNRIHKILYGRTDFDPSTFLARYRRHNAEVLEYFRHRPQDLLVFDVDSGHGWKELCAFLNVTQPSGTYPAVGVNGH